MKVGEPVKVNSDEKSAGQIGVIVESVDNMVNVFWSGGLTYWISKDKVNSIKVKDLVKGKNYENR